MKRTARIHPLPSHRMARTAWVAGVVGLAALSWWMLEADPVPEPAVVQAAPAAPAAPVMAPTIAVQPEAPAPLEVSAAPSLPPRTRTATKSADSQDRKDRLESAYAAYDSRLKPGAPVPPWATSRDFYADIAYADPNASIRAVACSDDFCRIDIQRQNDGQRSGEMTRKLATQVKSGEAVMFRYGRDGALSMYVINTSIREDLEPPTN